MNIKKICKILGTTTAMLSAVILAGIINNSPVYAAENNLESNPAENITSSSAVSVNQVIKKDYKIDVNTSIEKQGFKLTIKNVTATKHNLKVVASIEGNKLSDYYKDLSRDAILQMTVKNTESRSTDLISKKINDNTLEFTFNIESLKDFPDNIELRFDALLPQFDLNGWVNTKVDISKYFDKTYSEDIEFEMGENNFYKVESNVLGTYLYYKENRDNEYSSDEDRTWDSESKLLIKYNDKFYEADRDGSFIDYSDHSICGYYSTNMINIDDLELNNSLSVIPIQCNIKNKEVENIFDSRTQIEEECEYSNVKYNKEYKFADGSKGIVSKVERDDNKVKMYFSAPSEKDSLLMALSMDAYYDHNKDEFDSYNNSRDIKKIIYKNPDNKSEYIVEFDNVLDNKKVVIHADDIVFSNNDKFEMGKEIKIK